MRFIGLQQKQATYAYVTVKTTSKSYWTWWYDWNDMVECDTDCNLDKECWSVYKLVVGI